jgi:hypothetical protein
MPSVQFEWWGVRFLLDRSEGCFAATGVPELGDLLLLTIPPPYGPLALAAVKLHKKWIADNVGSEGVELHLNWAGFMHWVEPRGVREPCDAGRGMSQTPVMAAATY